MLGSSQLISSYLVFIWFHCALSSLQLDTGRWLIDNFQGTWAEAESYCLSTYGSHLASVDALFTNVVLGANISTTSLADAWVGFHTSSPNTFIWANGAKSPASPTWATAPTTEPVVTTNGCVYIDTNGDLFSVACSPSRTGVICDKRPFTTHSESKNGPYFAESFRLSQFDAAKWCLETHGTTLASLHSQSDRTALASLLQGTRPGWIGLTQTSSSVFEWDDGTPLDYINTFSDPASTSTCTFLDGVTNMYTSELCTFNSNNLMHALCNDLQSRLFTKTSTNFYYVDTWATPVEADAYCFSKTKTHLASIHDLASLNEILALTNQTVWTGLQNTGTDVAPVWQYTDKSLSTLNSIWNGGAAPSSATVGSFSVRLNAGVLEPNSEQAWLPFVCNKLYTLRYSRTYLVEVVQLNFTAADAYCTSNFGTRLASLHSSAEVAMLDTNFNVANVWVGLNNFTGSLAWLDGSLVDYSAGLSGASSSPCFMLGAVGNGLAPSDCSIARSFACNVYDATLPPSSVPSVSPTFAPSSIPSSVPSHAPSATPSVVPTMGPSIAPSSAPSSSPSSIPSAVPSHSPSTLPSQSPSTIPSGVPSSPPTVTPSSPPTAVPSLAPSTSPTFPTSAPTVTNEAVTSVGFLDQTVQGIKMGVILFGGIGIFVFMLCICFLIYQISRPKKNTFALTEKEVIDGRQMTVPSSAVIISEKGLASAQQSQQVQFTRAKSPRNFGSQKSTKKIELQRALSENADAVSPVAANWIQNNSEADQAPVAFAVDDHKQQTPGGFEGQGTTTTGDILLGVASLPEVLKAPEFLSSMGVTTQYDGMPGMGTKNEGGGRADTDASSESSSEESSSGEAESGDEETSSSEESSSDGQHQRARPETVAGLDDAAAFGYGPGLTRQDSKATVATRSTGRDSYSIGL